MVPAARPPNGVTDPAPRSANQTSWEARSIAQAASVQLTLVEAVPATGGNGRRIRDSMSRPPDLLWAVARPSSGQNHRVTVWSQPYHPPQPHSDDFCPSSISAHCHAPFLCSKDHLRTESQESTSAQPQYNAVIQEVFSRTLAVSHSTTSIPYGLLATTPSIHGCHC